MNYICIHLYYLVKMHLLYLKEMKMQLNKDVNILFTVVKRIIKKQK